MALLWCAEADIVRHCPTYLRLQLLDDDHSGVEDVGLATLTLEEAESEVVSRSAGNLNAAIVGQDLADARRLALVIWSYQVHCRLSGEVPEAVKDQYERALDELKGIAARQLGRTENPPVGARYGVVVKLDASGW